MLPNVLISSGGRRVALLQAFRTSLANRRPAAWVGTIDSAPSAPVRYVADRFWFVPRCADPAFPDTVLDICLAERIGLVVPTIDTELPVYARSRERFERAGITVAISSEATVAIACDKHATSNWLIASQFPTVRQASPAEVLSDLSGWQFPLIAKPHDGSASAGVQRILNQTELQHLVRTRPRYIVQETAGGREFTVNFYVNRQGKCVCAVPHWRMEVRAGEVSKGVTVKDERLISLARRIAEALPGARGPLNLQCFLDPDGVIAVIEINARFGGGYPLAHRAGARFTDWLLAEQEGQQIPPCDDWTASLAMLRYDDAVFVPGSDLASPD